MSWDGEPGPKANLEKAETYCTFLDLKVSDLHRILRDGIPEDMNIDETVYCFEMLKKAIDAYLSTDPQYASFYCFFDQLLAKKLPFKYAFEAAQVFCESRGFEIPLRYQARRRMRATKAGE